MTPLTLTLLGAFHAAAGDVVIDGFPTAKVRAVLVFLALEVNRPHARHTLAGLFWPDMPDAAALSNVRKSLHRLRRTLDARAPGLGDTVLRVTREAVQVDGALLDVDAVAFERQVAAVAAHDHRHLHLCTACLARLERAAALYRGELLPGLELVDAPAFNEWVAARRARLHYMARTALGSLADAHEARGDYGAVHATALRQLALDPVDEVAHRRAIRALAILGRPADALAQFEVCRRALADEIGAEPEAETTALVKRIRAEQSAASIDAADVGNLVVATPRPPQRLLRHAPTYFTPFVGRDAEVHQIDTLLLDPDCRLLTVIGPGGVGKTRLSVEVAGRIAAGLAPDTFRHAGSHGNRPVDGIYFVCLAEESDADRLPAAVAEGVGLTLREHDAPRRQVLDFLSAKRCLLVLDNAEHLVDGVEFLPHVLAAAPGVRMLVTSRRPLDLLAERLVRIDGLPLPPDDPHAHGVDAMTSGLWPAPDLQAATAFGAVALFVRLAEHFQPGLRLSPSDLAAVVRICRLVDGLPLAIEMAAAWLRSHDVAAIEQRIAGGLAGVATLLRDVPERHRSLQTVFHSSWSLLPPGARTALPRLSILRGSFSQDAALAVSGARPADLRALVDASLVRRTGEDRLELHALTRAMARRILDGESGAASDVDATMDRLSSWYLGRLLAFDRALDGSAPAGALRGFEADGENIRLAWDRAVDIADRGAILAHLRPLATFFRFRGQFQAGAAAFGRAASRADPPLAARLHAWHASFLSDSGQTEAAGEAIAAAIAAAEIAGDADGLAEARMVLGSLLVYRGAYAEARAAFEPAVAQRRAAGEPRVLARVLGAWGEFLMRTEDIGAARAAFEEALAIEERLGRRTGVAMMQNALAGVHGILGDYRRAMVYNGQALEHFRALGFQHDIASALGNRGYLSFCMGDDAAAVACLREALDYHTRLGYHKGAARHLANLGQVHLRRGEHAEAFAVFERAIAMLRAIGADGFADAILIDQAAALFGLGEVDAAREQALAGIARMTESGHAGHALEGRELLARIDAAKGG